MFWIGLSATYSKKQNNGRRRCDLPFALSIDKGELLINIPMPVKFFLNTTKAFSYSTGYKMIFDRSNNRIRILCQVSNRICEMMRTRINPTTIKKKKKTPSRRIASAEGVVCHYTGVKITTYTIDHLWPHSVLKRIGDPERRCELTQTVISMPVINGLLDAAPPSVREKLRAHLKDHQDRKPYLRLLNEHAAASYYSHLTREFMDQYIDKPTNQYTWNWVSNNTPETQKNNHRMQNQLSAIVTDPVEREIYIEAGLIPSQIA